MEERASDLEEDQWTEVEDTGTDKSEGEEWQEETKLSKPIPIRPLPEEIWEVILGMVTSAKDLQSCSETCTLWAGLLHSTIPHWMFDKVIPVLFKYLSKSEVLTCRLVSKSWSEAVDNYMENHPNFTTYSSKTPSALLRRSSFDHTLEENSFGPGIFRNRYPFWGRYDDTRYSNTPRPLSQIQAVGWVDWIKLFLVHWVAHDRNLLVGRCLSITEYLHDEDERIGKFWPIARLLLKKCGEHLHHLNLTFSRQIPSEVDNRDIYAFAGNALLLAPNLKTLSVCGDLAPSAKCTRKYGKDTSTLRLPPAQNLVRLELALNGMHPSVIYCILKTYSKQLRRLDLLRWRAPFSRLRWSTLTELHLTNVKSDKALGSLLRVHMPKLRKLGVCLNYKGKELSKLGEVIGHFDRLEVVRLSIPDIAFATSLLNKPFKTSPKLKTLEVHQTPVISRTLLRQLGVETIHINWQRAEIDGYIRMMTYWLEVDDELEKGTRPLGVAAKDQDTIIHLHPSGGSFFKSNVWNEVESIKVITYQEKVYTRDDYDRFMATTDWKRPVAVPYW